MNLSVKNVPDALADLLRRRATANRRSLQKELLSILAAAVGSADSADAQGASTPVQPALTVDELATLSRELFPVDTESSVAYLRALRESR